MRLFLVVALASLAVPAAANAGTRPQLTFQGSSWTSPQPQRGGWLLEQPDQGRVRVWSERDSRTFTQPLPAGCSAMALRFPTLLLSCGEPDARFMDVRTGAVRNVPRTPSSASLGCQGSGPTFAVFGKYWLYAQCGSHDGTMSNELYLNWRTGEERGVAVPKGSFADIDDPSLTLKRYERCPGTSFNLRPPLPEWIIAAKGNVLRLRRCSGGRKTLLTREGVNFGSVKGRFAAWTSPTKVELYEIASGKRWRWNLPKSDTASGYSTRLVLGERSLFVIAARGTGTSTRMLTYRAGLP